MNYLDTNGQATKASTLRLGLILCLTLCGVSAAWAQTTVFTYQGKLTDAGNPANANYDLEFKLFDALSGGTQQGTTQTRNPVTASAGVFTVTLDFGSNVFSGADRYLEIGVRPANSAIAYTVLAPRRAITATPYAMRSLNAASTDGLSASCVNCITSGQIQSVDGTQITGAIPVASVPTGSGNYIQNAVAGGAGKRALAQVGGFDITGDGVIGGNLIVNGGVGIGINNPTPGQLYVLNSNPGISAISGESATAPGVYGKSTGSRGVFGESEGVAGVYGANVNGAGVVGTSINGYGVQGASVGVGGFAGYFTNTGGGHGVYSETSTGRAIWGKSISSRGVYGESTSLEGVYGISSNGTGVSGASAGVAGFAGYFINTGGGHGVYSETTTGRAIWGKSTSSRGVYGESVSNVGVWGVSSSGQGVIGNSTTSNGVDGSSASVNGYGGHFINTAVGGKALRVDGTGSLGVLEITNGSDLAEKFEVEAEAKPGMVVAIDPQNPGKLSISCGAYNRRVAGIISGANNLSAGMVLPNLADVKNVQPVALSGRVWVYCDAAKSPIKPGDLLTTSVTPGHAMKVINHVRAQGAIIGKAMTELKSGKGLVLVLVTLQ